MSAGVRRWRTNGDSRAYVLVGELVLLRKAGAFADPLFALAEAATFGAAQRAGAART